MLSRLPPYEDTSDFPTTAEHEDRKKIVKNSEREKQ
jgi:hypothetical protein